MRRARCRFYDTRRDEYLERCTGFSTIRSGTDGRRERISMEAVESSSRCPPLLHANASFLGVLSRSEISSRSSCQYCRRSAPDCSGIFLRNNVRCQTSIVYYFNCTATLPFYTFDLMQKKKKTCKEPAVKLTLILNIEIKISYFICIIFYSLRRENFSKESHRSRELVKMVFQNSFSSVESRV